MKVNIKKVLINIIKYAFFLALGVFLFLNVTEGYKIKELFAELKKYNITYILIAVCFNILSNISRSFRWNLLLEPLGYKIKIFNVFLSVQVMYLANFFIPRAGEVAKCAVLARTDKVPFSKLVGTAVVERIIDAFTLLILSFIVFLTQIHVLKQYLSKNLNISGITFMNMITNIYVIIGFLFILLTVVFLIIFRKRLKKNGIYLKIKEFFKNILEGLKSIKKVKKPGALIMHTVFIYIMWFLMMITLFKGFEATSEMSVMPVLTVFVLSSLSMILPVPAGMGAFHFAVASGLELYGIKFLVGGVIAFIMHTSINLYLDIFGIISLIYLLFAYFKRLKNNS